MPPLDSDRGRIDDVTLDASGFEQAVDPKPVQPGLLNDDDPDDGTDPAPPFAFNRARRSSNAPPSPAVTACLDLFSTPGLFAVTSQEDLLSSSDTNSVILFSLTVPAIMVAG
jgi:hypothetical protein